MLVLITDRRDLGRTLSANLRKKGIFLIQCPNEVALFTCERYDTGGVLLDAVPDLLSAERLGTQLRQSYPEIPISVIAAKDQIPALPADRILRDDPDISLLADAAEQFYRVDCGWTLPVLSFYRLSMGVDVGSAVYMGYPLHLSPTEHMLLRCLLYRYPKITSADELLTLCFDNAQGVANLSVHISSINRRAAQLDPRPLIVNAYGKGYRLRDGLE